MERMFRLFRTLAAAFVLISAVCALAGCREANIDVTPTDLTIGNDLAPVTVEISTPERWSIECPNSWVTASPSSGHGSASVSLTAVPNSTEAARETEILITAGKAEGRVTVPVRVVQPPMDFQFSTDMVSLPVEGGTVEFEMFTDGPWSVLCDISWIENIEPVSGLGNARIRLTGLPSDKRYYQDGHLTFKIGNLNCRLPVRLEPLDNQSPEVPRLKSPEADAEGLSVLPVFTWDCQDPDGDDLKYTLWLTDNLSDWKKFETVEETYTPDSPLQVQTAYWWKVLADDGNGRENSTSESEVREFVTSGKTHYEDGEWLLIHEASVPNPVNLVFMGDGYVMDDCALGGKYISDMKEGLTELFSVEPYKEYEKYFNVYTVVAYSEQSGMTIVGQQTRNTRFGVKKVGEDRTALECEVETVFELAEGIPAVKGNLKNTPIFLMSNQNLYAGTCYLYSTGESIAIIPVSRLTDPVIYTNYGSILRHEGGGHAFGRLADEYITYEGHSIPQTGEWSVQSVVEWQSYDSWSNISIDQDPALMPWSSLTGLEGYSAITNPQGGLYYEYGVWRSEKQSCMIDNMPYYSAAQRMAIVRRLKKLAGEEFSLEDFVSRDKIKNPSAVLSVSKSASFKPLGAPVLLERRKD